MVWLSPQDNFDLAIIDIEETANCYALTWAPNPKHLKENQEINYRNHLVKIFSKFHRACSMFIICPELTLQGNIHYHGIFQVKDEIKWFKYILPTMKRQGFIKVKQIDDLPKWSKYIIKKLPIMAEMFSEYPVPYTHNEYKVIYIPRNGNKEYKAKAHYKFIEALQQKIDEEDPDIGDQFDMESQIRALLKI